MLAPDGWTWQGILQLMPQDETTTELRSDKPQGWLNRTVVGAGITSALGDVSHESATTVLPGFLAVLGIPAAPAVLGVIEGVSDATASFTKLGAGFFSDRLGRRKPFVVIGYALTASAQGLYALAFGWPLILMGRLLGWFGRGIRGPLRDAILSDAIPEGARGRAFGFHRAADTLGAIVGPLLGAGLLTVLQTQFAFQDLSTPFRIVFWCTLIPGFLSVLAFALLVREQERTPNKTLKFWATIRQLPIGFRRYLIAVGLFGLGDFAPTLLILAATQLQTSAWGVVAAAQVAAGLYVWRNVIYAAASFPVGWLADRMGHRPVLAVGYMLGALTALLTTIAFATESQSLLLLVVIFTIAGLYIAIEDSLEGAMTAEFVPTEYRGTAYGVLGSVNGIGDFVASSLVGILWAVVTPVAGFAAATVLMGLGALAIAGTRPRAQ
jgi:MFS family permease